MDVSFEDHAETPSALVLIECKLRDRVRLSDVKVLKATMCDVASARGEVYSVRGILVCSGRVQSGAQRYADYHGIHVESRVDEAE